MKNYGVFFFLWLTVLACKTPDLPAPVILPDLLTASQASLVSVQATGAAMAELMVKNIRLNESGWQLTVSTAGGSSPALTTGGTKSLADFALTTLRLNGLVAGQTYQLRLAFKFAERDSLVALRTYTHRPDAGPGPRWKRLAFASFSGGDYTGYPVAIDGICGPNPKNGCGHPGMGAYVGKQVQILRYPGPQQDFMDLQFYDRTNDNWSFFSESDQRVARQGCVQYNLFFMGVDRHQFSGLGFITEERSVSKYFYFRDMGVIFPDGGSALKPPYSGEAGELAFFTTTDEAYFLTQNGSPAMHSINAILTQTARAPLPEAPGTLATFSIRNIGYVVNQQLGQPGHLWAYDPVADAWTRKADFPGAVRSRGVGFAMARKGYFGLGLTPGGQGLRDLWQYDPTADRWQYVSEYPGQGHQLLAVFSAPDGAKPERAYLGWGYEAQQTSTGFNRVVGCTDWWELTP